jgi:hypothetical protein
MSHAHGWSTGPGGALTESVLGIRADGESERIDSSSGSDDNPLNAMSPPTSFVVAPQTSGLQWCSGRLTFGDTHQVDVKWLMSEDMFTLHLNLEHADANARGRVELPLFSGSNVEIMVDGVVVASLNGKLLNPPRHVIVVPIPLRSHVYVVRKVKHF